jgi:hypothetical protein
MLACGLLASLALPAAPAGSQELGPIRLSLQRRLEAPIVVRTAEKKSPLATAPSPPRRRRSLGRKILGGVLGGVGGFVGGVYLGAAIEGASCNCDDPGLRGAIVGAPIGLVLGAIAGVALASR